MPSATDSRNQGGRREIDKREINMRELARIVRAAALSCYGINDVVGTGAVARVANMLGRDTGVRISDKPLRIALNLELSPIVQREQVLANVRDAVSYAVQRELGRPIDELTLTVDGR